MRPPKSAARSMTVPRFSNSGDMNCLHGVPHVARRIPQRAHRLGLAFDEVGRLGEDGTVKAAELHLDRLAADAGTLQNRLDGNARPSRIPHRAVAQLPSTDPRRNEAAAISRAL